MFATLRSAAFGFLFVPILLTGCAGIQKGPKAFVPSPAEKHLVDGIVLRLQISRDVAWTKFKNHLPVRNPARESQLLDAMESRYRNEPETWPQARLFLRSQIDASCLVQAACIRYWSRGGELPAYPPKNLQTDLRERLDLVTGQLLDNFDLLAPQGFRPGLHGYAYEAICHAGFSWKVARAAAAPLKAAKGVAAQK